MTYPPFDVKREIPHPRNRPSTSVKRASQAFAWAVAAVSSVLCLAVAAGWLAGKGFIWCLATNRPEVLPDGGNFFPEFGLVEVAFANGGAFSRNDTYGDQLWDELVPVGAGYVRVQDPRKYGLPHSEPVEDAGTGYAEMFQASVVHQLHCMAVLRNYTRAYENGVPPPFGGHFHVKHCIDYVRQAILCTADTTLEQSDAKGAFLAQDAVHQCRDWRVVKAFIEEHRVDDEHPGILDT